jgi:uncharacterized protein (DUF885 family)
MTEFNRREVLLASGAVLALAACRDRTAPTAAGEGDAAALLDTVANEHLQLFPTQATELGLDVGERAALKSRLSDASPAGQARLREWLQSAVSRLDSVRESGAEPAMLAHAEVARTAYQTSLDGFAFPYGDVHVAGWRNGPYVVAQNMGSYLDVPKLLDADHTVAAPADAEAYLARLSAHAKQLDGETERLRADRGRGVVAPSMVVHKTLSALRQTQSGNPSEWLIVTSLGKRAEKIPGDWTARAERIAGTEVAPALARQLTELEQHRRVATADFGAWKLPEGEAYYAWALRAATTTQRTPDEIHRQGTEELKRFTSEMDTLMRSLGFTSGSVGERFQAMQKDRRYAFAEGDAGRAEILAFIEAQLAELRPRLPQAFGKLSRGNVEVRRIPPAEELGAPGAYGGPGSIDGKVPGKFWINLRSTDMHSRVDLPSLTYHEAIPGHVWQGEYTIRLPLIRAVTASGFSAFSEGWGLYAEQLGGELGAYQDNPEGRVGYLQSMAFRAARMVVDTGIHTKRWTRERALTWFAEATGGTVESVASEIDRYSVWPGQACGYKVGHTEINRQRTRAQQALGQRFDVRAFNDLVVGGGARPLTVLAGDVDRLIEERRA